MATALDCFRLLDPAAADRLRAQSPPTTRRLRLLAIAVGATATLLSLAAGICSYRASYQMQLNALLRTNAAMAEALAEHSVPDSRVQASSDPLDPLDLIMAAWEKMPREDPEMFACVVARDGTLLLNSQRPEEVGRNVARIELPATALRPATSVGELAAAQRDWAGVNKSAAGIPQLVAFKYSQPLGCLIVVHTPESSYAAKLHQTMLPWLIAFGGSSLLLWPLGLLLMNLAYGRARTRADSAERERHASEQLFEQIFDQAAIGVALIHTESGRFARINGKYESLIGYANEEIKAKSWQEITHPDDLSADVERMEWLKAGNVREFELQKRLIRKDGSTMWVNLAVSPTWSAGENCSYHIAVIEDITERRQGALALAESEHRFRTLVEHAPEAIVVFDVDQQRFVDFNDNALRMFGVAREEMRQATPTLLSPAFQPDGRRSEVGAQALIARALAGEALIQEWVHCDREGREIVCEVRLVRLYATGRRLIRGSITDIRQRKQAEEQFRRQQSELAHVSRLSVMGEMVAGIAHEINQPLFAITNYAHTCGRVLSQENLSNPDVLDWCLDIEREATRAAEIIRRLRDFTRKSEHLQVPVDVNAAVLETIALLMLDSRQHKVCIQTELTGESVMIQGDPIGLQQVFVNLIRNACESLAKAEVVGRMVTVKTEQHGPLVDIEVVDNGPGFDHRDVDQIFDPFYSTKTGGMGMGLAISRTLVEAHGGTLTASNAQCGALLRITLPRLEGATRQDVVASHA